jgi:hypothetical protein
MSINAMIDNGRSIYLQWVEELPDDGREYFVISYGHKSREAMIAHEIQLMEAFDMKIYKSKLFPHITGDMMKDKPVTLVMSGKVNLVDVGRDSKESSWRLEVFFENHDKSAILNKTEVRKIANLYSDDTDNWRGKAINLYGEYGKWFGKNQWGLRVEEYMPKQPQANGRKQAAVKAEAEQQALIEESDTTYQE